jgi:hypothetical protein
MALIGTSYKSIGRKSFNDATQTWPATFTTGVYRAYAGQGFDLPVDLDWINKPTGLEAAGGVVMGFPRSAESTGGGPLAGNGSLGWIVKEC